MKKEVKYLCECGEDCGYCVPITVTISIDYFRSLQGYEKEVEKGLLYEDKLHEMRLAVWGPGKWEEEEDCYGFSYREFKCELYRDILNGKLMGKATDGTKEIEWKPRKDLSLRDGELGLRKKIEKWVEEHE